MTRVGSWIVFVGAVALHAQSLPRDTALPQQANAGAIRGRVIAADGGEPLRNARVTITGPSSVPRIFTDGDGRFLFSNLTFGRYVLLVRKAGYVETRFGSRRPADPPMWIQITAESPVFSAEVRVPRSAAISGRILDEQGDPIALAQVSAERVIRTDGRVSTTTMASATTDDLGEYRLGGLPDGRFAVSARRNANSEVRFTLVDGRPVPERPDDAPLRGYYPGVTTLSQAHLIDARKGEERSSVDFTIVQHRQPPTMVRLSFVDEDGKSILAIPVLASLDDATGGNVIGTGNISDTIAQRVDPGTWLLVAHAIYGPGVAAVPIVVGSTDISMSVRLRRGGRIIGRVKTEGGPAPTTPIEIEARPVDPALTRMPTPPSVARARAGETFTLTDLIGTRELRIRSAPHGWVVKAILAGGRDLLDTPIVFNGDEQLTGVEIVLTHDLAELSGTAGKSTVLLFPEHPEQYRDVRRLARWVRPNSDGRFVVDDVLPGTYFVLATNDVDDAQWANADYLEQFRAYATRVTLRAGERKSIALPATANP
jgi:hypothetical protein